MAKKSKNYSAKRTEVNEKRRNARSLRLAKTPIRTGQQFANLMSSLMSDLIEEKVSTSISNAVVNAGGKLLKVVELQFKHGRPDVYGNKTISLISPNKS